MRITRTWTSLGAVAGVLLFAMGHATARQQVPAQSPDLFPRLRISITGGFSTGRASASLLLSTDTWSEVSAYAGTRSDDPSGLCRAGMVTGVPGTRVGVPPTEDPVASWHLSARLLSLDADAATVELRWRRLVMSQQLEPLVNHEATATWRIAEGEVTVVDALHAPGARDPRCSSASVIAEYVVGVSHEFWHAAIVYDAWLLQRLPSGETRTSHMRSTGAPGEKVSLMFPRVDLALPATADHEAQRLDLSVTGGVRGRLRTNGRIDLVVDASRWVMPRGGAMGTGIGGRTHLSVAPGETVEFEPVQIPGDWNGLQYAAIFRQAPTAIRIRASRAW